MITVGVDLAAEARSTALAVLQWSRTGAAVTEVVVGVEDAQILEAAARAGKVGVDCPFGWPEAFVDLVDAHREHRLAPPASSGRGWRAPMTLRATDIDVYARHGLTPLSVSADRIGHTALRWAAIAAALDASGADCVRDGSGLIAEVYPAAALKVWGLPYRRYKGKDGRPTREALIDSLGATAPWLDWGGHELACRESDHALDAVVAALIAREVATGRSTWPTSPSPADTEGWIHVPSGGLTLDR